MSYVRLHTIRLLIITSILALFATSFVSVSYAAVPQKVQWHFTLHESCKNLSFCGIKYVETINGTATGLSSGKMTFHEYIKETIPGLGTSTGHGTFKGTWTTGPAPMRNFVISGIETIKVVTSSGSITTQVQFVKAPILFPVKVVSLDCAQLFLKPCPNGVSASEVVTETVS
jgi:hypothetical protein